jgi:dipeptide/tripeptide permease
MNQPSDLLESNAGSPAPIPDKHPPAIWFFFWGEFAERSSYYGMRAILFLYMTQALRFSVIEASPIYAAFKMGCYLLPLLGGLLADRWIGRYWTIVGFSVPYVLGHFILGFSDPTILGEAIGGLSTQRLEFIANMLLFVSLALLAGGSGVIKPNISSLLGQTYDQKRPGKERLRSSAFLWFYLAINVGALISQLALPAIRESYIMSHLDAEALQEAQKLIADGKGEDVSRLASPEVLGRAYQLAFAFPTVLMALSLGVFAAGKRTYAREDYGRKDLTPEERRERLESLLFVLGIYGLFALYFAFDQFGLPRIPDDVQKGAKAGAIALTLAAVVFLIARSVLVAGKRTFAAEEHEGRHLTIEQQRQHLKALGYLLGIFALVVFFWFGYEHNDVLWIGFTRDYVNLNVPLVHYLTGKDTIAPDQLQFLNSLFVIILIPVFNATFKYFDPDLKIFTAMRKVLAGFLLTAAAIGIMAAAGYLAQGHTTNISIRGELTEVCQEAYKVSFLWPAMAYIVLTFGEVLLYGTMLDLSYAAAPKSMKGYITACFLLTNTLGNFLNILWMPFYGGSLTDPLDKRGLLLPGPFFAITAALTVAAAIAFFFIGRRFDRAYRYAEFDRSHVVDRVTPPERAEGAIRSEEDHDRLIEG